MPLRCVGRADNHKTIFHIDAQFWVSPNCDCNFHAWFGIAAHSSCLSNRYSHLGLGGLCLHSASDVALHSLAHCVVFSKDDHIDTNLFARHMFRTHKHSWNRTNCTCISTVCMPNSSQHNPYYSMAQLFTCSMWQPTCRVFALP